MLNSEGLAAILWVRWTAASCRCEHLKTYPVNSRAKSKNGELNNLQRELVNNLKVARESFPGLKLVSLVAFLYSSGWQLFQGGGDCLLSVLVQHPVEHKCWEEIIITIIILNQWGQHLTNSNPQIERGALLADSGECKPVWKEQSRQDKISPLVIWPNMGQFSDSTNVTSLPMRWFPWQHQALFQGMGHYTPSVPQPRGFLKVRSWRWCHPFCPPGSWDRRAWGTLPVAWWCVNRSKHRTAKRPAPKN